MANLIGKLKEGPLPKKSSHIDLEKRVRYALDCLEADMPEKAEKARNFLKEAQHRLDNPELISQIDKVLNHGT